MLTLHYLFYYDLNASQKMVIASNDLDPFQRRLALRWSP